MAGELETAEDDDGDEVSCLQGAGGRVKPAVDCHGLLKGLLDFRVRKGLHESARPKFVKQFHFSSLSMAVMAGLEPTTRCLEGSCSVQMSYRTKFGVLYHNHAERGDNLGMFIPLCGRGRM